MQEFRALNGRAVTWLWLSSREALTTIAPMDFLARLDLLLLLRDAKAPAILEFVSKQ